MMRFSKFAAMAAVVLMGACGDTVVAKKDMTVTGTDGGTPMPDLMTSLNGAPSGAACATNTDCAPGSGANETGKCTKSEMLAGGKMLTYTGGFCTSACKSTRNDKTTGTNPECPGGNATCEDGANRCVPQCQSSSDCRDATYACFVVNSISAAPLGCLPKALSQCDPQKRGSCAGNGGGLGTGDGGTSDGGGTVADMTGPTTPADMTGASYPQTCVNIGDGTVGACVPGCDPFSNGGCDQGGTSPGCHASDVTGEGLCTSDSGNVAGGACGNFYSDCPGGYGCLSGKCWKYCNDTNKGTQCSAGATCMKFSSSTTVPTSIAGICSKSS